MGVINPMLHHNESEWSADRPLAVESDHRGQSKTLWVLVVVLGAAFGALAYYGNRVIKSQNAHIMQLFGSQGTLTTLGQRADAAESKLHDLAGDWQGMGQRVTKLEGRVAADAKETRLYAEKLTQQMHQEITAELDARTSTLDARLRQVESEQADQRAQMARVEANLKQDISAVREENGRDLSGVRQQEESNARDVNAISQKLDRRRIDFEITKGQNRELAPGISLQIRGTNVAHQRYHGALTLEQAHRTVWLRDQSADEPVRFLHKDGEDPYELVVTDVTKKAVAGYLLAPVKPDAATGALVGQRTQGGSSAQE
jgi:chaperonin cofactor prefoldin